ncbi:uncharacterized protein PV09_06459 [Verruconis gallopava]|uniref:protein O-GlcNAc transferase n=1 Tax=Verruconis gallopava TaxID=253628 RepID=A0A0D1YNM6_9PEZI|nr:uncharacterized protein PV09_06459 [Verruconis gallopava]KIW02312.1 hypothetical protein PV09_06459 [Verruconis gallopava]
MAASSMIRQQHALPVSVMPTHPQQPRPSNYVRWAAAPPSLPNLDNSAMTSNSSTPRAIGTEHRSQQPHEEHTSRSSMQYARPLQRNQSYPPHGSPKNENVQPTTSSEHMLRRKTPNGILNAAYDGTAVEQIERPHAMKHILLPASDQVTENVLGGTLNGSIPLRPHAQAFDPTYGSHSSGSVWQHKPSWIPSQPQVPQIDSMLNQMPLQNPSLQYMQTGHHPFAFMPPPPQPSFGPTASNDIAPFGPYWPNGTYVPYRPAAMRDMRYYPQHTTNWAGQASPLGHTAVNSAWANTGNQYLDMSNLNLNSPQTFLPRSGNSHGAPAQRGRFYGAENRPFDGHGLGTHEPMFPPSRPQRTSTGYESGLESGQTTPTPHNYRSSKPLAEYGADSSNAELREKIFSWAHSIYIDLLKHLHEARRRSHHRHGGQHGSSGPHIYPRPPRQPGVDFSRPSRHRSNSEYGSRGIRHDNSVENGSTRPNAPPQLLSRPYAGRHGDVPSAWPALGVHPSDPRSTERHPSLRRMTTSLTPSFNSIVRVDAGPAGDASAALGTLTEMCRDSGWTWIDGLLLGGCLAYALGDYTKATEWYTKILELDSNHVEAMSNLAATMLATHRKKEAERFWSQAVKLRPSYFEAVEHLVGLLCGEHRGKDAIAVIEHVQKALQLSRVDNGVLADHRSETGSSVSETPSLNEVMDQPVFDFDKDPDRSSKDYSELPGSNQPGFGSSGYSIAGADNGRILQLVHAKGNMLYAMGDNVGAAKAFEEAVMIGVGRQFGTIDGLIKHILTMVNRASGLSMRPSPTVDPILLTPTQALETSKLCFPNHGELPGLKYIVREGQGRKAVVSTTSNSLLSLAKIFQDGIASSSSKSAVFKTTFGVREILALYYLSLSLQPSPSTANNVGILLAGVQQVAPHSATTADNKHLYPGVAPGSGVHLALLYYHYGLHLDQKHAHLYTNYGSLLKDIGQLSLAIQMYEQAVKCDPNFDIALANLANAVKDTGRIADAISYYKRAVKANPDFAEAVCGLANALNSVCGWQGRGGIVSKDGSYDRWHVNDENMPVDASRPGVQSSGWMKRVVDLVDKQLADGEEWAKGVISPDFIETMLKFVPMVERSPQELVDRQQSLKRALQSWSGFKWEGARVVRLVERIIKRLRWRWYHDKYVDGRERPLECYKRPTLPSAITIPAAPTVLPFHTFTCPMSAKQVRHISQRNGLRISSSTLKAPWLPDTVYRPPPPPNPVLRVGYVSSDFNNHPLAHLMQSVFGLHDRRRVEAFCYATTASDNSVHRKQIEREAPHFYDATTWSTEKLVSKIVDDGIHILVNLNGYTRGARNEVFAARPAPVQMSFMGFAGTLGAEWCDYLLADETAVPVSTLRPWRRNVDIEDQIEDEQSSAENDDWIYGENIVYCRDTFFCCDHRQSAPDAKERQLNWDEEQERRWKMRKELFPTLADDAIIFGNFNQLYKIEPTTFRTWLRILARVPKAVLWLLRFPDLGETYLKQTAEKWATPEVASRIIFTDVAPKHMHISRARVCDLFLDTPECNAHTTAADVLWSGTPLLTLPRYQYKMCSRMAASILKGALPKNEEGNKAARDLIANNEDDYERKAILLGNSLTYNGHRPIGRLGELRKLLYEARWTSGLFDTTRWVRDLEEAYEIAWDRWIKGEGGDIWLKPAKTRV